MNSLAAEYKRFEEYQVKLKKLALRFNDDSYKRDFAAKEVLKSLEQVKSLVQELKSKNVNVDPGIEEKILEISKKYSGK